MRPARSLQSRLTVSVLMVVVVFWLGALGLAHHEARHDLEELLDAHLEQGAALLALQASAAPAGVLPHYTDIAAFQVFQGDRLALRSDNAPATPMFELPAGRTSGFATLTIAGTAWRVFATRDSALDRRIFIGEREKSRTDILDALLHSGAIPMLFSLPLLAAAVWWAVRRAIAPMRRMGALLRERRPQSLDPIVIDHVPPELSPLLAALNGLLGRIQTLIDTERRFTADAAHELRTPIAAIRMQAQVALGESEAGPREHALAATVAGCDRATRVVEQLLTLSRLEAATVVPLGPIDVCGVIGGLAAELAPSARAKQQHFAVEVPEACRARGEATLLAVLVRNLLDNAIRYSPPGARIELTVLAGDGRVQLHFEDSGPGMADTDLARLGERFFRVVGSGESGSGLGWSIARRAAAAQGAVLQLRRSERLGGLHIVVSLASV